MRNLAALFLFLAFSASAFAQGTQPLPNVPKAVVPLAGTETVPIIQKGYVRQVPLMALSNVQTLIPFSVLCNPTPSTAVGQPCLQVPLSALPRATGSTVGVAQPDNTTITINSSGILSATGTTTGTSPLSMQAFSTQAGAL